MKEDPGNPRVLAIIPGCIVCKTCEFHASDIFEVKEKTLSAEVLTSHPAADRLPDVLEAIRRCPEHVITYKKERNSKCP